MLNHNFSDLGVSLNPFSWFSKEEKTVEKASTVERQSLFQKYWSAIKDKISEIKGLGARLTEIEHRYNKLIEQAAKTKNKALEEKSMAGLNRIKAIQTSWNWVNDKIEKYLPTWMQMEKEQKSGVAGITFANYSAMDMYYTNYSDASRLGEYGIVPLIIIPAIAAAGGVFAYGLKLIADYRRESDIQKALAEGSLSQDQAKTLLSSKPSFVGAMGEAAGTYLGLGLLVAIGYFIYTKQTGKRLI